MIKRDKSYLAINEKPPFLRLYISIQADKATNFFAVSWQILLLIIKEETKLPNLPI